MQTMVMKIVRINQQTKKIEVRRDKRLIFGAFICSAAGFFAPLLGLIFAVVHAAVKNDTVLRRLSTILFVAAFPLLFAGSHLLDVERDRRKKRRRMELEKDLKF